MSESVGDLPSWQSREDLDPRYLANALEHIRRMAWMHFIGDAFDPEHMHAISAVAAQALCGQPIDSPVDMTAPEFRRMAAEQADQWTALCDDAVVTQARYEPEGSNADG